VVVTRRNIGGQRAEGVERRLVAAFQLLVHVLLDQLHRHMARAFDHALHIVLPGDLGQLAEGFQLAELRGVVGVGNRPRTQAIAQREADVVGLHDFADFVEMGVEEVLFVVRQAPLGHDRTTARHNAGHPLGGQRYIAQQHAGVDGEVVHALLGLFDQGVAEQLPGQVFGHTVDLLQRLVNRHGTNRHRRVADDPLAGFVDVLAGGQVHDRVRTPADAPGQLGHFFFNRRTQRTVADIAVDLHQEVTADDHRLQLNVVDVGRDNGAATGDFFAHELGGDFFRDAGAEAVTRVLLVQQAGGAGFLQLHVFADGDVFHLGGDDALTRIVHLGNVGAGLGPTRVFDVGEAQFGQFSVFEAHLPEIGAQAWQALSIITVVDPGRTHIAQAFAHVNLHGRVGIRAGGVVDQYRGVHFAAKIGRCDIQADFTHRHQNVRARTLYIDFLRAGKRLDRLLIDLGRITEIDRVFWFCTHHGSPDCIQADCRRENLKNVRMHPRTGC